MASKSTKRFKRLHRFHYLTHHDNFIMDLLDGYVVVFYAGIRSIIFAGRRRHPYFRDEWPKWPYVVLDLLSGFTVIAALLLPVCFLLLIAYIVFTPVEGLIIAYIVFTPVEGLSSTPAFIMMGLLLTAPALFLTLMVLVRVPPWSRDENHIVQGNPITQL